MQKISCFIPGCSFYPSEKCETDNFCFCKAHSELHKTENESHLIEASQNYSITPKKYLKLLQYDPANTQYTLCQLKNSSFIFFLKYTKISLPFDYSEAVRGMTSAFIDKILSLQTGKSEKIKPKCIKYISSLKQLIYNIAIDISTISEKVINAYNFFHSSLEIIVCDNLRKFLDNCERALEMTSKVSSFFVFQTKLEDQRQRFIEKFLTLEKIDMKTLSAEFFSSFSKFITGKPESVYDQLDCFELNYRREKIALVNETKKVINDIV